MEDQAKVTAFHCHSSDDADFVIEVAKHLKRNLDDVFYYEEYEMRGDQQFNTRVGNALKACDVMVVFIGKRLSEYQIGEVNSFKSLKNEEGTNSKRRFFMVLLPGRISVPTELFSIDGYSLLKVKGTSPLDALELAQKIVDGLGITWKSLDGLPSDPYLFDYEKLVIEYFTEKAKLDAQIKVIQVKLEWLSSEAPQSDNPERLDSPGAPTPSLDLRGAKKAGKTKTAARVIGQPEESEQDLRAQLDQVRKKHGEKVREKQLQGCPAKWPDVAYLSLPRLKNEVPESIIGTYRPTDHRVAAAALERYVRECFDPDSRSLLGFPEAGPREMLFKPPVGRPLNVAVLVSGGIAPGINAVIDGITQRHKLYADWNKYEVVVYGFKNGFMAFENLIAASFILNPQPGATFIKALSTADHTSEGGSILGTARFEELMQAATTNDHLATIAQRLLVFPIDILYVIGGDGSMRAAHAVWNYAQQLAKQNDRHERPLSVVGIPKTMDNDILWVWQTFGFMSAVQRAREFIDDLAVEVRSNPRLGVMQLFGSDSGFVVSHAVLASGSGICDAALIPEVEFSMKALAQHVKARITKRAHEQQNFIPYGLVVMAETAIPVDADEYLEDKPEDEIKIGLSDAERQAVREFLEMREGKKKLRGQTKDELRTAGLKIVSRGLLRLLSTKMEGGVPDWRKLRIVANEPRHLLRAIPPGTSDIINAQRLGVLAVDNALAGYTDFMVSQWLTEYVLVPLGLVVLGRKRIPGDGIFWKSVITKTGQNSPLL